MINYISVPRRLRYSVSGNQANPKKVLYALHGYGQLTEFFIRKFHDVPDDFLVICPEGPHRFYLSGSSGRVGASWMTKVEREVDIEDNLEYLNTLHASIQEKYPTIERIYFLGFSQGGAAAARWVELGSLEPDTLILWATVYPPDLDASFSSTPKNRFFIIGENDEYYQGEALKQVINSYDNMGFKIKTFNGKHEINNDILLSILNNF